MTGALLLALALSAAPAPRAAEAARRGPVRVDADEAQYAFQRREVTFSGKKPVVLTRDDATLTCRKIVAKTDEGGQIASATCTGDVRFVRGLRTVTCDQATYEDAAERVTCDGNAVLRDAATEAKGTRLVYDLRVDAVNLENAIITVPGDELDKRREEVEAKRKAKQAAGAAAPRGERQAEPRKEKRQ